MSDHNIFTLSKEFKDIAELKSYCDKQFITIQKQTETIRNLENEIHHLKDLLSSTTEIISSPIEKIIVSKEETLLVAQINMFYQRGLDREFTLEETKILDLLIKNLNLIRGNNTSIVGESKKVRKNISDAELLETAAKLIKKTE